MHGTSNTVGKKTCVTPLWGLAAMLLVLAIAGCALAPIDSEVDYPLSFPKLVRPVGPCPAVGGSISNRGERHNPASGLVVRQCGDRRSAGSAQLTGGRTVSSTRRAAPIACDRGDAGALQKLYIVGRPSVHLHSRRQ